MNKKVMMITGVLVAGAVGVLVFDKSKEKDRDLRLGKGLVSFADVARVEAISIEKGPTSAKLVLGADKVWRINDVDGFPADAAKVTRLLDALTSTKLQVLASSTKEAMNDFGFDTATAVSLQASGESMADIKLGGSRDRGGQYVSFADESHVYLISQPVSALPDTDQWELKTLVDVKATDVRRVDFSPASAIGKKAVTLSREKSEDPIKAEGLPNGSTESLGIRSHESILNMITFSRRMDLDNEEYKAAMAKPSTAKVSLFDGRIYSVNVGSSGKDNPKYFLRIEAQKGEHTAESDVRELDFLNGLNTKYAFEVPAYVAKKFEQGLEDMVEKKGS